MSWNFYLTFLFFLLESSTSINGQNCLGIAPTPIGTGINGKSYHFIPKMSGGWNWENGKKECACTVGMTLASIPTVEVFNYLGNNFGGGFEGLYWTSGRDVQTTHQFSWDKTNMEPLDTFKFQNLNVLPFQTCLLFNSEGVNSTLIPQSCSLMNSRVGVLCEMDLP